MFTQGRDNDYFLRGVVKEATGYSPKVLGITMVSIIMTPYFVVFWHRYIFDLSVRCGYIMGWLLFLLLAVLKSQEQSPLEESDALFSALVILFHSSLHIWQMADTSFHSVALYLRFLRVVITANKLEVVIIFSLVLMLILQLIGDALFSKFVVRGG